MTGPGRAPPVGGQTAFSFQGIVRRVVRPDLTTRRKVWAVAWPVVVTNFLQSLALTVDLIMVSRIDPADPLPVAATGVAAQVFFIAMTLGNGLAAGATALVARGIGAGDEEEANRSATATALLAVALSLPLIVATFLFDVPLLRLMGADPAVLDNASLVLRILAFGIPGNLLILACTGAFQGAGDTRPALWIGIGVNAVNLGVDWLLIFGHLGLPRLGLAGAAIATASSYTVGGLVFLGLLRRGRRPLRWSGRALRFRETSKRLLRVGAPAGLEQLLLTLGFTAYLVLILRFGAGALTAHQIGLRVQSFAFMPGFGFAAAASALVGQGLGAGDPEQAESNGWTAIAMGLVVMLGVSIPMFLLAEPMARLFTENPESLALGVTWIHVLVFAMPAIAFHFSAAGALRGAGDTRWPLLVSFLGLWLVRLPVAWLLGVQMGYGMYGVWAGYMIEYYARAVLTTIRFARGKWKTLKV